MTTCEELIRFLADYLADEVPADTRARFEAHLVGCASCRAYLASYRTTIGLAKASAEGPEIEDVPPELVAAILATIARQPPE